MPRGYSASRTGSKRPTLRLKRERSVSMHALRTTVQQRAATPGSSTTVGDTAATPNKGERGRSQSTAQRRTERSASTLRQRIAEMEEELASDLEASEDERETVAKPDVMSKYKAAGRVVDEVLDELAAAAIPGADTKALCDMGDESIATRLRTLFSKARDEQGRRLQKGVCYPTNISVNEVLCNHSPYRADEAVVLRAGNVVKLHCGCHLDGYPVVAARTVVVHEPSTEDPSHGLAKSTAGAIEAARLALTVMIHALRPGAVNADITDLVAAVGCGCGAEAVEGVLSNRVKRWVLDGVDCIIARRIVDTIPQQDVGECEIAPQQVWALDVAFTNTLGTDEENRAADKSRQEEEEENGRRNAGRDALPHVSRSAANADDKKCYRTTPTEEAATIFRRTPMDFATDARVQHANDVLKEVTDKFGCFPFHFKALANPLKGKMGVNVLLKHQVVDKISPLRVKNSLSGRRITARYAATVAVTAKRITVLCGAPPESAPSAPQVALPPSVTRVLAQSLDFATAATLKAEGKGGAKRDSTGAPSAKRARTAK